MTSKEASEVLKASPIQQMSFCKVVVNGKAFNVREALDMAIKSLEAWEIINDNLSQQVHHNLDVKEKFEIGSTSRIECNTTASVLAGVIYLIDKHLAEVENESENENI